MTRLHVLSRCPCSELLQLETELGGYHEEEGDNCDEDGGEEEKRKEKKKVGEKNKKKQEDKSSLFSEAQKGVKTRPPRVNTWKIDSVTRSCWLFFFIEQLNKWEREWVS